jgi:hypothetical protein
MPVGSAALQGEGLKFGRCARWALYAGQHIDRVLPSGRVALREVSAGGGDHFTGLDKSAEAVRAEEADLGHVQHYPCGALAGDELDELGEQMHGAQIDLAP